MDETERTAVKTYVPRYQKEVWEEDADDLGMSRSEFVRTMVQAGRSEMTLTDPAERGSSGVDPWGDALETHLQRALSGEPRSWDEVLDSVAADVEAALGRLQDAGEVRYTPKGYERTDE